MADDVSRFRSKIAESRANPKYAPGHHEHTDDCMSEWGENSRLAMTPETITENHRLHLADAFPHVSADRIRIVIRYGHLLNNTGGNDPLDLLNDLHKPHPNWLVRTNMVRFTLATMVEAQVVLLVDMEKKGLIRSE